ncbi:cupredoxin domain-containing protein [Paenibacillus sp. CF384]|uniref:cupredoxin domain-containing protein n=1 Tax=Paenibacillus sp. CF384 TaxID=1884382 RepID=UPI00089BDA6E|nr:cupredoxin domain-containing protein [Paenibacillus sp. CF384]SDW18409.1 Cupredoxin-like domain-containing protein [Paenibacillus sp. CF384]
MKLRLLVITAVLAMAAFGLAGCGGKDNDNTGNNTNNGANSGNNTGTNTGSNNSSGGGKTITVKASNFKFDQEEIHVKQGDKVKITLQDEEGVHGFAIDDFKVDIQENNGTAEFTADKAGEHPFHCSIMCGSGHAKMVGKLIVD